MTYDGLSDAQLRLVRESVATQRATQASRPLEVAILGATGGGKSSLTNALFGTSLATGDDRPVTKEPQLVRVAGSGGHPIDFWDLPGFGESTAADAGYLDLYRERLVAADVVIWVIHSDNRSTTYDVECLGAVLRAVDPASRRELLSRITFVMTKVDMLTPPPWIFSMNGDTGSFVPARPLADRLDRKATYYEEVFVGPWRELLRSSTYNPGGVTVDDTLFTCDEHTIRYDGHFTQRLCDAYTARRPEHAEIFARLRDNHRVLPCSALFRFNLTQLMVVVVNKLGPGAVARFQRVLAGIENLSRVPVSTMRGLGNVIVWDADRERRVFDLQEVPFTTKESR